MGKTSVARALVHNVRDAFAKSWTSCSADGSAPPFWPWRDLIAADDHSGAGQSAWRTRLLARSGSNVCDGARTDTRAARDTPAVARDRGLAMGRRRVCPVARADRRTRRRDVPLLVLATVRPAKPCRPSLTDAMEQVYRWRVSAGCRLSRNPTSPRWKARWATGGSRDGAPLHHRTGGVPLLVSELLRSRRREG